MQNDLPRPTYYHSKDKQRCKVCRALLKKPVQQSNKRVLTVLNMLYNRALCSADCLFKDYEDLDKLTDNLYQKIESLLGELADRETFTIEDKQWKP